MAQGFCGHCMTLNSKQGCQLGKAWAEVSRRPLGGDYRKQGTRVDQLDCSEHVGEPRWLYQGVHESSELL